jgi:hypothetical protein
MAMEMYVTFAPGSMSIVTVAVSFGQIGCVR